MEPSGGAASHRILVVDDNSDAAESISILLSNAGHEVRTAYDGQSGIELAKAFMPEIVFLDLGMPGMDGFETAKELRALQSDLKVIALTGWGQEADRRRSAEACFDGHLVKPATFSALQKQIAQMKT
jgi:CheY-like chemotaxis protein